MKRCRHRAGWYVEHARLMADSDGSGLTILRPRYGRGTRDDKALATCNEGCGATRNVYLDFIDIRLGRVRRFSAEDDE